MAFYFVSTFAIAQTPTKQPALRLSRTKNLHFAKATFPGFSANDRREHSLTLDILSFAAAYIEGWDSLNNIVAQVAKQYYANGFTEEVIKAQFEFFSSTLSSIEGFLLSNWDIDGREISETDVTQLAEETLAYFLADEKKRDQIQELFKLLAENISKNINDPSRRKTFGKTLYGVNDAQAIEEWVQSNAAQLFSVVNEKEFLNIVWPLMIKHVHNRVFKKFDKPEVLKEIAHGWIDGNPFNDLLKIIRKRKTKMIWGSRRRKFKALTTPSRFVKALLPMTVLCW
jgi:hypothetical protein